MTRTNLIRGAGMTAGGVLFVALGLALAWPPPDDPREVFAMAVGCFAAARVMFLSAAAFAVWGVIKRSERGWALFGTTNALLLAGLFYGAGAYLRSSPS